MTDAARRLLLVHAHPDDETLTTGGTIARYVA
ncbi:PIG-L family deacetylase, partial [Rhodococcus sp. CX]|nr:PIG-L family deacetylase [Rhodococcus sp. CX]